MPDYVSDPDHPGQHIDIIELVRRYPDKPPPVNVEGLLKRDLWTRQEALLILCGLAPHNVVHGGLPIGAIGAGIVYLDGIASAQLDAQGLQHPRAQEWLPKFMTLAGYAAGQDMNERKPPAEWIAWAESKGFMPYWLDDAATEDSEKVARRATGRYTLREAAKEIARHGGARWGDILERLSAAWAARDLPVFRPGSKVDSKPGDAGLHRYYMEAHWSDLNAWLAKNLPHSDWRFPAPLPIERAAAADEPPKARDTPAGWLAWADGLGEPVHVVGYRLAVMKFTEPEATPAGEAATIAGPPPMGNSTKGKRAHPLAAQIRKAQAQAEKAGDAAARWEKGAVWAPLRAMALEECGPFTGVVSAKGLEYTDAANCRQVFTPGALAAHLKRQREKVTPADAIRR